MKFIRVILMAAMMIISSTLLAQVKGEMAFSSSSPEAIKLLRSAWVAYGDAKFVEAKGYVTAALEKDPEFGMAHVFTDVANDGEREQGLKKALTCRLSADEKLFIDGLVNRHGRKPAAEYFEPLLQKYPKDLYLNLWIMFNYEDLKRKKEIGEMITKRNPKFAPAYNLLGYSYMAHKDFTNAETSFNKYIALRPDLANTYDSKADYLMRVGKIEEAITMFEKAAELGMAPAKSRADVARAKLKFPPPSEVEVQKIRDIISASSAGFLKGDIDAILKNYSDQSMEFFPSQMVNAGIGNIRVRLGQAFNSGSFTKFERTIESVQGTGGIAVAWGKTETAFKSSYNGNVSESKRDDIFLLRKQQDGEWKILAQHWFVANTEDQGQPSDNTAAVREVVDKWSFFMKPGEVLTQEHVEKVAAIYSAHGVDILPDQRSIIGMANLRLRLNGFKGIKWAQFTEVGFDINSLASVGAKGFERKAVAWGIGDHSNYPVGSDTVAKYLFPWAMILTKEKDDQWKILVYHFYIE
jgi:ketosteroid isomerase-like protein